MLDQLQTNGIPEIRTDVLVRFPENDRNHRDVGKVAEAGELLQRRLGLSGQARQLPDHEVHHIVGVPLGVNAIELPAPARRVMIEAEQPLLGERRNELNGEKRIATRLLVHQSRQWGGTVRRAAKRIRNEPDQVFLGERRKTDFLHESSRLADSTERAQKRMRGTDFVLPVGADQQHVPHFRVRHQMLEEVERCCIQPLQIIEEQRERMLLAREHPEEAPEHHLEAVLRVLRRQVRDRWLFPDHELQLGNEVDDELAIEAQHLDERIAPPAKLGLALAQEQADKAPEGLRQRRIRDVALVLVELAGGEKAARRHQRLVQFIDDGGLADARIAGEQHQLRPAAGDDAVEGAEQGLDLALSPIQFLGNQKPVGCVLLAQRESVDPVLSLPCGKAAPEVALQAGRGLVALLGGLGE